MVKNVKILDKMGTDEMGIDKMGIDEMGIDKVGINQFRNIVCYRSD